MMSGGDGVRTRGREPLRQVGASVGVRESEGRRAGASRAGLPWWAENKVAAKNQNKIIFLFFFQIQIFVTVPNSNFWS
jgi:hypothetical protein